MPRTCCATHTTGANHHHYRHHHLHNDVQGDTEERVYEAGKLHGTATFTSHTGDREERFVQIMIKMIMIINLGVCQQNYDHDGGKIFTMDSFSNFELTNYMSCLYNFTAATMILQMTTLGATCPVVSTAQPNIITPAERSSRGCTKMGSYRFTMMIMFLRMIIRSISDKSNNYDYILTICLIF